MAYSLVIALVSFHNKNVKVILDSHHEFLNAIENENSNNCAEGAIFWEGQTATLHALNQINALMHYCI